MPITGSCQCGSVVYQVEGRPLMTYACYCSDCQKRTGSAFSLGMILPRSAIHVEGELTEWTRISDQGFHNTRFSCAGCGTIIYGIGGASPETLKLQPGTLDDTSELSVDAHIWTRSAQPWLKFPDDALIYTTQPDDPRQVLEDVLRRKSVE